MHALLAAAAAFTLAGGGDQRITAAGVGKLELGDRYTTLRAAGVVGKLRPGCPLAGSGTRGARLKAPLRGFVDLSRSRPRRVRTITVTGAGASARGVGVGDTLAAIRDAYPGARVDRRTEDVFGITLVKVPRKLQFAVDVDTGRVAQIAVPAIRFCE